MTIEILTSGETRPGVNDGDPITWSCRRCEKPRKVILRLVDGHSAIALCQPCLKQICSIAFVAEGDGP